MIKNQVIQMESYISPKRQIRVGDPQFGSLIHHPGHRMVIVEIIVP
jgi:hypothetical protein